MTTLTLEIPQELKRKILHFSDINWAAVARQAFMQKLRDLEFLVEFKAKSELTEKEALALGEKVSLATAKRYSTKQSKRQKG